MRHLIIAVVSFAAVSFAGCHKGSNANTIVAEGTLEKQGITTYQYGSHVLRGTNTWVLTSATVNLNAFVGKKVVVTAFDKGPQVEYGPTLYEVTSLKEE